MALPNKLDRARFTKPASNGGSPIVGYYVMSSPEGGIGALRQSGSGTLQVTGLSPETTYTFKVKTTNQMGGSSFSDASASVTTPRQPGTPKIAAATATSATTATVAFTAPTFDGGLPITQYTATSSPGGITGTVAQAGSGTITVAGLTPSTAYTFTVTATNAAGTSFSSGPSESITTNGPPGAPAIGAATATSATTANVAFTAPASNGGSPITQYTATSNPGGITGTVTQAGAGTITVSGLTAGTVYTFKVTATNALGTSVASEASASVTPKGPPGAPAIGAATATSAWTATVAFTAPASNGGSPITHYTATSNPGGITGTLAQEGSGTITVTGLTAGTGYTFKVTATNAAGTSVMSQATASVKTALFGVGSTGPGGGKVFYASTTGFSCGPDLTSTCNYLEVAPSDAPVSPWCSNSTWETKAGSRGLAIGVGFQNTLKMLDGDCTKSAAIVARSYAGGGLSDWHLPSVYELQALNRTQNELGFLPGKDHDHHYWSSSKLSDRSAYTVNTFGGSGGFGADDLKAWHPVRPIRAF